MAIAIVALGRDSDSAPLRAPTPNCRLNSGISGCTQYSSPNVATPAATGRGWRAGSPACRGGSGPAAAGARRGVHGAPHTAASRAAASSLAVPTPAGRSASGRRPRPRVRVRIPGRSRSTSRSTRAAHVDVPLEPGRERGFPPRRRHARVRCAQFGNRARFDPASRAHRCPTRTGSSARRASGAAGR